MNTRPTLIHVIAQCADCKWSTEDYMTGQAEAKRHARNKKHKVSIELGLYAMYDGKPKVRSAHA